MTRTTRFALRLAVAAMLCAAPALPAGAAPASPADQALWSAVYKNDLAGAKAALAAGAHPGVVNDATFADDTAKHYVTTSALEVAMDRSSFALAGLLVDKGADVNARDGYGYTPLLELSQNTPLAVVQKLIDGGANVNAVGYNHVPALSRACIFGRADIVRLLLAHGAPVDRRDAGGGTALMVAGCSGHLDIVKLLVAHGASVYAKADNHESALTAAAATSTDTVAVMRFLLRRGLDINQRAADGSTALQGAAYFGNLANVKFLLAHGADVRAKDHNSETPILRARRGKNELEAAPARFDQVIGLLRAAGETQ